MDVQRLRHGLVDRGQELLELGGAMLTMQLADDGPVGDVERRGQAGDAVALVVVVRRSGVPGSIASTGWERSSAWIWDFSSTHNTTARSGGLCYSPTISTTFSIHSGSVDSLKVSVRCG
jgi:hypothetical protein